MLRHFVRGHFQLSFCPPFPEPAIPCCNLVADFIPHHHSRSSFWKAIDSAAMQYMGFESLHTALVVVAYSFCSGGMILFNKLAMHHMPYPSLVSVIQFLTCTIAIQCLGLFNAIELDPLQWHKVKVYRCSAPCPSCKACAFCQIVPPDSIVLYPPSPMRKRSEVKSLDPILAQLEPAVGTGGEGTIAHCTACTPHTAHCTTMCTAHCTIVHTVHCAATHSAHSKLCTWRTVHCALCNPCGLHPHHTQNTKYPAHCALGTLYTADCILCTLHTVQSAHGTLCTVPLTCNYRALAPPCKCLQTTADPCPPS